MIFLSAAAALSLCGCDAVTPETYVTDTTVETTTQAAYFVRPAEFETLALDRSDISSQDTVFTYAQDGRIIRCAYDYGVGPVSVEYTYTDDRIVVAAFLGSTRLAQEVFSAGSFDPDLGFSSAGGYYFFGYEVNS